MALADGAWSGARIRTKLLILMLGVGIPAVVVIGGAGYARGKRAVEQQVFDHLTSVRATKAREVEDYLARTRASLVTLSSGPRVVAAMRGLAGAYAELDAAGVSDAERARLRAWYASDFVPTLRRHHNGRAVDEFVPTNPAAVTLQLAFLVDNLHPTDRRIEQTESPAAGAYGALHARFHPSLRNFVDGLGFYDVFLIDAETGAIVYTAVKETDFATSLLSGPHRDSGLARAFRAVRESDAGTAVLIDFDSYDPSYGAPAAFLATPIFDGGERVGVLAAQLPVDRLNRVMTGARSWRVDGLGESGETYLVGSDFLMRSDSRFLLEEPDGFAAALARDGVDETSIARILVYDTTILQLPVRTRASKAALSGIADTAIIPDYRGVPVLSSYTPLAVEDVHWVLLSEMDAAEAFASSRRFARGVFLAGGLMILAVVIASAGAARVFTRPIEALVAGARAVRGGDLDVQVDVRGRDELAELGRDFNQMVTEIREQTEEIRQKNLENERLLLNILPRPVAERLKAGEGIIADAFEDVSVLFADLVGFTTFSRDKPPQLVVDLLNDLFTDFDRLAVANRIEKIKTFGDAYMAVAGVPEPRRDHARAVAELALGMREAVRS